MIKITNKIVNDGQIIGYRFDNDGFVFDAPSKALYESTYFDDIRKSGYKFYSYNADEIEDAAGKPISELPAIDFSETDQDMWNALMDLAAGALPESEVSKYYEYHNSYLEFKKADASDITIHTREELMEYIAGIKQMSDEGGFSSDNKPLNSFVAEEALFTLDEILNDDEIKTAYITLAARHKFRDWNGYQDVVEFLVSKGVLQTHTPTYLEFLVAYNAWGIDGIKGDCIKMETLQSEDSVFTERNSNIANASILHLYNRKEKLILWDERDHAHYLTRDVDMSELTEFAREPIVLGKAAYLFDMKRNPEPWNSKYKVTKGLVANVSDRLMYSFVSPSGYPFFIKITHNEVCIFNHNIVTVDTTNFAIRSIQSGIYFTLDNIKSQDDYALWNLALAKVSDIYKDRNVDVPVSSSFELLLSDGVNPKAAIMKMVHDLKYSNYECMKTWVDSFQKKPNYFNAFEDYCSRVPDKIIETYNLSEDIEMDDCIDAIAGDMVDSDNKSTKLSADVKFMNSIMGEGQFNPVSWTDKVSFVKACFNNEVVINAFGDGMAEDGISTILSAVELVMSVVYAHIGYNASFGMKTEVINNFENSGLINIEKVFKKRDHAFKGYVVDLANLRRDRANQSYYWMYCTRVFREISNAPIEKQRPYLMEVITVDRNHETLRTKLTKCVEESVPEGLDDMMKSVFIASAGSIAARLFFYMLGSKNLEDARQGDNYILPASIPGVDKFDVVIPKLLYDSVKLFDVDANRMYITLYDYCRYEYGDNGAFSLYMVNADVTPWSVVPKKGFSIANYNFVVNFSPLEAFDVLGEEWKNALAVAGGKPCTALGRVASDKFIPEVNEIYDTTPDDYDDDSIKTVLENSIRETIALYRKRWFSTRNNARAVGAKLYSIPLKQDIVWHNIAKYFCEEVPEVNEVMFDDPTADDGICLKTVDKGVTKYSESGTKLLEYNGVRPKKFEISDYDYDSIFSMNSLIRGNFTPSAIVYIRANSLVIFTNGEPNAIPYSSMTLDSLSKLAAAKIVLQLNANTFFVKAFNGNFVLEV